MAPSIGLNLRVTGYVNQGGRKYMEDVFSVAYQQTEDEKDLEYAFFGIFDGHGGREAAVFAKEHLMDFIVKQKIFWADDDESVLRAIREGFLQTHQAMWGELEKWPKTVSGLPSTAGTTASIAFIRRGKIYIGHVGDSAIVLGFEESNSDKEDKLWKAEALTIDHKPESDEECKRIEKSGGKVICKSGVPRVVWNRPKMGHKGPVRRSTHIDEIPFLAVARSLGDLWSYNSEEDVFVVSPEPDTYVYPIDIAKNRCLILGTDGAWNMLTPAQAVAHVCQAERSNEQHMLYPHNVISEKSISANGRQWINPSKYLVDRAIERWNGNNLRADNTSIVTVMLDPPGPPRAQVLKRQRELAVLKCVNINSQEDVPSNYNAIDEHSNEDVNTDTLDLNSRGSVALVTNADADGLEHDLSSNCTTKPNDLKEDKNILKKRTASEISSNDSIANQPKSVSIISRFPNSKNVDEVQGHGLVPSSSRVLHDFQTSGASKSFAKRHPPPLPEKNFDSRDRVISKSKTIPTPYNALSAQSVAALTKLTVKRNISPVVSNADSYSANQLGQQNSGPYNSWQNSKPAQSNMDQQVPTSLATTDTKSDALRADPHATPLTDEFIQCNEVSSSDDETSVMHNAPSKISAAKIVFGVSSSGNKSLKTILKETRSSRELNALQLDSPNFTSNYKNHRRTNPMRRRRVETGDHSSDTENEEHIINRPAEKRTLRSSNLHTFTPTCDEKEVLEQCKKLNNKIRNMERKVAKETEELNNQVRKLQSKLVVAGQRPSKSYTKSSRNQHNLRSSQSLCFKPAIVPARHGASSMVPSQARSLRSNATSCMSSKKTPNTCSNMKPVTSNRKRKLSLEHAVQTFKIQPAKSPRNIAASVVRGSAINKRPIMHTRSKRARVLHLKK